jgi:hypothetical protein
MPNTSSTLVDGTGLSGRSNTPSAVSTTSNLVPGAHLRLARTALGRTTCPLLDNLVMSMRASRL